ncbi:MAG: DUF4367 domain-containing protein [Clostridiales bacterium]|nr:DUF4367 domain-containing protein [Clostridiales bacterium]
MKRHEECFFKTEAELYQELEDILLRLTFSRLQREDAQQLERAVAEMAGTPQGEEIEAALRTLRPRVMRTITRSVTLERARYFSAVTLPKIARATAMCLLVFFLGLTTAIATVRPVRVKVLELIVNIEQEYTEIRLRDRSAAPLAVPDGWEGEYYLTAVPEGFSLTQLNNLDNMCMVEYKNEAQTESVLFVETTQKVVTKIDTEGEPTESTFIHGYPALIMFKDNITHIVWSENDKHFMLKYFGSKDNAITLAEGVERIK